MGGVGLRGSEGGETTTVKRPHASRHSSAEELENDDLEREEAGPFREEKEEESEEPAESVEEEEEV